MNQRNKLFANYASFLFGILIVLPNIVFATSGACSGHGGVDCSAGPDDDGSVICKDDWMNSSVQYSSMVMCNGITSSTPSVSSPIVPVVSASNMENYTSFSDVKSSYKYANAVKFVKDSAIVNGYEDGTFKAGNKINRAEFTKILVNYQFPGADLTMSGCFGDVSGWAEPYVCFAKNKGLIDGYPDNTFKPEKAITVPEVLKISLLATHGSIADDSSGNWYQKYMSFAQSHDLKLSEWGSLDYQITRGEMAELINRMSLMK